MDGPISLPVLFSAIGAVAGVLLQQAIDVWKTRTAHRQELQRRFFEVKLQTALDLAKSLDALVASHQARLDEAVERTRDDENFSHLALSQDVLLLHGRALEKNYDSYLAAFAVLELLFGPTVVTSAHGGVAFELTKAWCAFDDDWDTLVRALQAVIPEKRMEIMRKQRDANQWDESAREQMIQWMTVYKSLTANLRARIPHLAQLTLQAEEHRRSVLLAIRKEMGPYSV